MIPVHVDLFASRCCARSDVDRSTLGAPTYVDLGTLFEVKGGAYSVTLHLIINRRALAGVIARGLSLHKKISRLRVNFVRGSRERAATYMYMQSV